MSAIQITQRRSLSPPRESPPAWQLAIRDAIRTPEELCRLLDLPHDLAARAAAGVEAFGLLVPRGFVARMRRGDPQDPLLRQVLPGAAEALAVPGFTADPVGDVAATRRAGLLQKYQGRALLIATGACAVHCRYCFRRKFTYSESAAGDVRWQRALDLLALDPSIEEVILSGGDPLSLPDERLAHLADRLNALPHLRRLRLHTRLPIVIPERVCDDLLAWLTGGRLTPVVVVHANHPAEIDGDVAAALGRLIEAGVPVLNQSVLLRGVNDCVDVLAELCRRLIDARVMPYYLHQLDRVEGAADFEVSPERGKALMDQLRRRLPGYAVPRYVREVAGEASKSPLA